ncbi:MarR family winged helix-turn-helix transcriptional regulator [Demequina iriomotensis]|uniref:MarR family winged helix-turn-helix transcriptional regulator n=1 Tax=Demequina iriomotensis TaxID=1536641 RepID=UPI000785BE47|nr:MarR family transcriptional regulator [Demequina iriomotensis]
MFDLWGLGRTAPAGPAPTIHAVLRAAHVLELALDREFRGATLTPVQARAAMVLDTRRAGRTISDLAFELGTGAPAASRLLTRLERKGLVERDIGFDGREVTARLTGPGRRAWRDAAPRLERVERDVSALLESERHGDVRELHRLLEVAAELARRRGNPLRDLRAVPPLFLDGA